jgi:hypothetical protein
MGQNEKVIAQSTGVGLALIAAVLAVYAYLYWH